MQPSPSSLSYHKAEHSATWELGVQGKSRPEERWD